MNSIAMCNDQASFVVAKCMTYTKGYSTDVAVAMEVGGGVGGNIITCSKEISELCSRKYCKCYRSTSYIKPGICAFGV